MYWSDVRKEWKINIIDDYGPNKDTSEGLIYSNIDEMCPEDITEWFHKSQTSPDTQITVVEGV